MTVIQQRDSATDSILADTGTVSMNTTQKAQITFINVTKVIKHVNTTKC